MIADFRRLVDLFVGERIEFVIIGAVALAAHGGTRVTVDFDVC